MVLRASEVRKIREEMTEKMEDKYGKMLGELRESVVGTEGLLQAQKTEISQLKGLFLSLFLAERVRSDWFRAAVQAWWPRKRPT